MKYLSQRSIVIQAYVWLALPTLIWTAAWLRPGIAILLSLSIIATLLNIFLGPKKKECFSSPSFSNVRIDKKYLTIVFLLFLFVCFTGVGAVYYQLPGDAHYRNAIFYDLVRNPWPVVYSDNTAEAPSVLCYFFGFWLPPAIISKATGYILPGDIAQLLYAFWGLTIIFNFLFSRFGGKARYIILATFLLYCGWDIVISMIFNRIPSNMIQLIFDPKSIQTHFYASNATYSLFIYNYNQAYPAFIALLLLYHSRNKPGLLIFAYSLLFIFSPFCAAGILPLFAIRFFRNIRQYITWQNLVGTTVFLAESAFFLSNNNGSSPTATSDTDRPDILAAGIAFVFFSYCIYLPWIWNSVKRDPVFYILGTTMFAAPYLSLGGEPDLGWRAGIPFAVYYMMKIMHRVIKIRNWRKPTNTIFAIMLSIGAIAPLTHYAKGLVVPILHYAGHDHILATGFGLPPEHFHFAWKDGHLMGNLHSRNNWCYNNFFADGDSFFTRYLMRRQ